MSRRIALVVFLLLTMIAVASGSAASAGAHPLAARAPDPPESKSAPRAAATAGAVSGGASAVVITLDLKAAGNTPATAPDKTPSQVAGSAIDASRPWFQQVSHGVFSGYFALNRGPVTVQSAKPVCSREWLTDIADQADAAIAKREPSLVPSRYNVFVYYFGTVAACNAPFPGAPNGAAGWNLGKRVWLNGDSSLRVSVHELGHSLGLNHSGSQSCRDSFGRTVPLSTTCTSDEYGDVFSAMGNKLSDGYSPSQLAQLGWNDGNVTTVTPSDVARQYLLTKPEANTPGATHALRLLDGNTTLWLEYRRPEGRFDDSGLNGGLLVRREQPELSGSPFLLAMNAPDFGRPHLDLDVGQTWANPLGTMQITLDSLDGTGNGAVVTIRSSVPDPRKTVPELVGLSKTAASGAVFAAGLTVGHVGTQVDWGCVNLNIVLAQTPAPGTRLPAGSPVDFTYWIKPPRGCPTPQ